MSEDKLKFYRGETGPGLIEGLPPEDQRRPANYACYFSQTQGVDYHHYGDIFVPHEGLDLSVIEGAVKAMKSQSFAPGLTGKKVDFEIDHEAHTIRITPATAAPLGATGANLGATGPQLPDIDEAVGKIGDPVEPNLFDPGVEQ